MFERFTEQSVNVMTLAQEEARRMGHNWIGTEQILLGLIAEGKGVAARALGSLGVNLSPARIAVQNIIGEGSGFVAREVPFTPRGRRVLELSSAHAQGGMIGTEHLLLGILTEAEGVAVSALMNLGIEIEKIKERVNAMAGGQDFPKLAEPPVMPELHQDEEAGSIASSKEEAIDPALLNLQLHQSRCRA